MSFIPTKSPSKAILESWEDLSALDFSHAFMIIDMQPFFIGTSSKKTEAMWYYKKLKINIIEEVEKTLNNNWLILRVEYRHRGDTAEEINQLLAQSKDRVITLTKNSMSLVSDYNEYGESLKIEDTLNEIKARSAQVRLSWVQTSKCVHGTNRNLYHLWIETRVSLWHTLNLYWDRTFEQGNMLSQVRSDYKKLSHLLDYWDKPINLKYLSDYL